MSLLDLTNPQHQLLRERLQPYIDEATAPATRKAYRTDLRHFQDWGGRLPAPPQVVADYLVHLAQNHKPATLQRRLASISRAHSTLNLPNPVPSELVRLTMRGIRRKLGVAQRQVRPLMRDDLVAVVSQLGDTPRDLRDKALLLIGFCGAFRRSELMALDMADIEPTPQGLVVTIRHSKTDQNGEGRKVGIPRGRVPDLCPSQSLAAWLAVANITSGPVFRAVGKGGHITPRRLAPKAVAVIVKERAAAVGLTATELSGHSLRAGLATSAAQAGMRPDKIKAQTGHASDTMLARYIRDGDIWRDNAGGLF
jgi:integrase